MKLAIRKRGDRPVQVTPEFTRFGDNVVIGSTTGTERFQVLTLRDGKVVDIQGCETQREAERFARRAAARR